MKRKVIKNLSIRGLLLSGFFLLIIMIIFLGINAIRQSNRLWKDTSELYNHPFKVNIAVREIQRDIIDMQRSLKDAVLATDKTDMDHFISEIETNKAKVDKNFDLVTELYLGKRSTVDSARNLFEEWTLIRDTTLALKRAGKVNEAAFRTTRVASVFVEKMMAGIMKLQEFAMQKATSFYNAAEVKKKNLQIQMAIYAAALFLFLIIFFIILIRSITIPLNEISEIAEKQRLGNYSSRSSIDATNEIGNFAKTFNRMAESIEHEMNLKNRITAITEVFIASNDLLLAGQQLLTLLVTETNSQIGAIYFTDEANTGLEPWFTVGISAEEARKFTAQSFEGEFGRPLLEKKLVHLKEIPEDTPFRLYTVSGSFRPREIISMPVIQENRVIAMISLASLYCYTERMLQMLTLSSKNISIGIVNILTYEKIKEYSYKLDRQNTLLENQSKELRLQTEELLEQNTELEMQKRQINESSRLKSEFLANMSHELRTPLNSVIALSGVLNKRLNNKIPEEEFSYLEIIERNGKLLLHLINDILDLSRIEAGKAEFRYSAFSLYELVDSVTETLQIQAFEKGIRLLNTIPEDLPMIRSDITKCRHILQNLMDNAVKFTDRGSVEINAELAGNEVHIHVTDTGMGIPREHLTRIFDEFLQVDGSSTRKHKGTGLGLAIAKKYSEMLDGRIEVKSEPGKGSVFTLILPVEPAVKKEYTDPGVTAMEMAGNNNKQISGDSGNENRKILIVEDNEAAIIQLTEILEENRYAVNIARSGIEALEHVKIIIPDAIILDLMMPEMDGFEVLEKIRSTPETAKIPVLILTSKYLSGNDLQKLSENHVHQLIQKGDVSKQELLNAIESIFHVSKAVVKQPHNPKSGRCSILVIEDNPDNIKTVQALLAGRHEVLIAGDGKSGLDKAISHKPDVILLDISLPGMDGYEVFDEIRKVPDLENIPVIALTARVMKGDREHILDYGFNDYISKPIDIELFESTLMNYISYEN